MLTILYGSQTGNAQDLAERVWRESKRFYFSGCCTPMDDYHIPELVCETCVIFVCSTTGQGEEPDNMKRFWRFLLRKNLSSDSLLNLRYAVLGLGDSSYVKFNFVAKRLHKRLQQLGAQSLLPCALGDDQHDLGYDAVADPWIDSLWQQLLLLYPLPNGVQPLDRHQLIVPRWNVTTSTKSTPSLVNATQSIYYSTRSSNDFTVTVLENRRVTTEDHFQDVRLLRLRTNGTQYKPGDVIVLRPRNRPEHITEFQSVLAENGVHIDPNTIIDVAASSPETPPPACLRYSVTFQKLCEEYFDLSAIPRRRTFEILAQLTDNELEREKCLEFTSAEGQNDLYDYCNRPRRNIVEVLGDFRHATRRLDVPMMFELVQAMKPRDFSIASSHRRCGDVIEVLVAVVRYRTRLVKERLGLCSNYLADLEVGSEMGAYIKRGSFKFPTDPECPIVMVGPGTGVAPFRSFIHERIATKNATSDNLVLFFGCRNMTKDFFCDDLVAHADAGTLNLICAFSRDQDHKIYVQHKILEQAESVWRVLASPKAHILVAGNAKNMPRDVRAAFVDVCAKHGGMDDEQAERYIEQMEKENRYQTETWS